MVNINSKKKNSFILSKWLEKNINNDKLLINFIKKCNRIYNLDYDKIQKFIDLFIWYEKILANVLKQNNEYYITKLNIKCKKNGKKGVVYIPYEKWCELNQDQEGMDISNNLKNNITLNKKKNYCSNWNEEKKRCDGYWWDYVNLNRYLVQDLDQKIILDKIYEFRILLNKLDSIIITKINKTNIEFLKDENIKFKKFIESITDFDLSEFDILLNNNLLKNKFSLKSSYSFIIGNIIYSLALFSVLRNLYISYPSILSIEINSLYRWLLLLLCSIIKKI